MTRAGIYNKRLLGEIALQLDKRILRYIFTRRHHHQPPPHCHCHYDIIPAPGVLLAATCGRQLVLFNLFKSL